MRSTDRFPIGCKVRFPGKNAVIERKIAENDIELTPIVERCDGVVTGPGGVSCNRLVLSEYGALWEVSLSQLERRE